MVKIKICGIRLEREVRCLNEALPDYAGFVFAPSKRRVTPHEAASLIKALDQRIAPIGVFVNEALDFIIQTVGLCGLKGIQLHGDEGADDAMALRKNLPRPIEIWKAIKVSQSGTSWILNRDSPLYDRILFDGPVPGSGKSYDYSILPDRRENIILAGGLTPDNVIRAIAAVHPSGVDVSSGVEGEDGYKDEELIKAFIKAARFKEE